MTPDIATLTDLQAHLATGPRTLGCLAYWEGVSNVRIPRTTFRSEFERIGLGEAVGRDPKAEACLNMAAAVAARRGKGAQVKIQLKEKNTHAVYAVLMRRDVASTAGEDGRVRYLEEARVMVDRGQPSPAPVVVTASDVDPDDTRDEVIADMIAEYTDILSNIRTQECSEALMSSMHILGGLSLRSGVYFVPAASMPALLELKAFMSSHAGVEVATWAINANDANVAQSRRDARSAFLDKVRVLVDECKEFADAKGDDMTTKSINARIARFQHLDGQAQLYADILGDQVTELRAVIEGARSNFTKAVLGDE